MQQGIMSHQQSMMFQNQQQMLEAQRNEEYLQQQRMQAGSQYLQVKRVFFFSLTYASTLL